MLLIVSAPYLNICLIPTSLRFSKGLGLLQKCIPLRGPGLTQELQV